MNLRLEIDLNGRTVQVVVSGAKYTMPNRHAENRDDYLGGWEFDLSCNLDGERLVLTEAEEEELEQIAIRILKDVDDELVNWFSYE